MSLQIQKVTAYSAVVTTAVAKTYLKQSYGTDTAEDDIVASLVQGAHEYLEKLLNVSLTADTTWKVLTDEPEDFIELELPHSPHTSITKVEGLDEEETATELTLNSDYYKRGLDRYVLNFESLGNSSGIPRGSITNYDTIKIEYVAGFTSVPEPIKTALLQIVAASYVNRGDGQMTLTIPEKAKQLALPYRVAPWI